MKFAPDPVAEVASRYQHLVGRDSPQLAAAITAISVLYGPDAALRAALIVTVLKMEIQRNHWIADFGVHAVLLEDYPKALLLLETAINACMPTWINAEFEPSPYKLGHSADLANFVEASIPPIQFERPVDGT